MQLKTIPEDFIVVEQAHNILVPQGPFVLIEMTKRNLTTERALSMIAERLDLPRRFIGYAGTKDTRALTKQYVTVKASSLAISRLQNFTRENLVIRVLGHVQEPLGLGMLESNRFEIVVRQMHNEKISAITKIPNFFDEQRFSTANVDIGRLILKKNYLEAAHLIITTDPYAASKMKEYLDERSTDGVGALRLVPKHVLLMYVHAYQSHLFNIVLTRYILSQDSNAVTVLGPVEITVPTKDLQDISIPIVGYGTALVEPFASWYAELLDHDGLEERDFVVRSIPFLSSEGGARDAFFAISSLIVNPVEDDDIHSGCKKQSLSFVLPKGCYATMVIKCLYREGDLRGEKESVV